MTDILDKFSPARHGEIYMEEHAGSGKESVPDITPEVITEEEDAIAGKVLGRHLHEAPITPEEEARVRRKIDWMLMPIMIGVSVLQAADKGILGQGAVFGLLADQQLSYTEVVNGVTTTNTGRFSIATSMFYIGYLIGAYPISLVTQKFPIAKVAGVVVILWAVTLLCAPACHTYQTATVQRFFLGFLESGVTPSYTFMTSMWYRKDEQAFRLPLWFAAGFGPGLSIAYLINYGLLHIAGPLAPWKILYFFWGSITVVFGVIAFFFLPDSPVSTTHLTDRERFVAIERLRSNQDGIKNTKIKPEQIIEALLDVKLWFLALAMFCTPFVNGLGSTFLPIVVKGFGFTSYQSILMSVPTGFIAGFIAIFGGYIGQKKKNVRIILMLVFLLPVVIGLAFLWKLPRTNIPGLLVCTYIVFPYAGVVALILALVPSNFAGTSKKLTATGVMFVAYCCGNIGGPLVFKATQSPTYIDGFLADTIAICLSICFISIYGALCWRENRRRDALGHIAQEDHAFHDLTDKQNLTFRYAL